jgi:hypothetical protein
MSPKALANIESPKTNLEAVTRYFLKGDIALNTEQELLLQRLTFTDDKIRSRKYTRDEIIAFIVGRFKVTQWRAEQDITDTHRLFGATRKISKTYVLAQHIENIERQIHMATEARRLDLLPKLNDALTYALNSLPEEGKDYDQPPFKIVFINNSDKSAELRTVDELLLGCEKMLKEKTTPDDDEYLDFEEDPDEA